MTDPLDKQALSCPLRRSRRKPISRKPSWPALRTRRSGDDSLDDQDLLPRLLPTRCAPTGSKKRQFEMA